MKGGKGGQGRKRSTTKIVEKPKQHSGAKRGAPKKDWGAMVNDDEDRQAVTPPKAAPKKR
jgi:hypothetical protein